MSITKEKAYTDLGLLINSDEYKGLSSDQKVKKLFELADNVSIDANCLTITPYNSTFQVI